MVFIVDRPGFALVKLFNGIDMILTKRSDDKLVPVRGFDKFLLNL